MSNRSVSLFPRQIQQNVEQQNLRYMFCASLLPSDGPVQSHSAVEGVKGPRKLNLENIKIKPVSISNARIFQTVVENALGRPGPTLSSHIFCKLETRDPVKLLTQRKRNRATRNMDILEFISSKISSKVSQNFT